MTIRWLTNSCFEMNCNGTVIVTDPCLKYTSYKGFAADSFKSGVDYVAISHLHWDHISEIKELEALYHPVYFTGAMGFEAFCSYVNPNTSMAFPMYPSQCLSFEGFSVTCLYNRHWNVGKTYAEQESSCFSDKELFQAHPGLDKLQGLGGLEMNSYLFTFDDGHMVLFWGGDVTYSQKAMLRGLAPDLLLAQFSAKDMEKRAELLEAIKPKTLIFHHQDIYETEEVYTPKLKAFSSIYSGNLVILKHGQCLEL